ncbi:MAG: SDR family NAD(P)-dependent oxidoreductase [Ruminococcaceae bacterium]|nr:SDR family NAD(P)-dependent oxidoreductase [Oscillospiraceae bacterium]
MKDILITGACGGMGKAAVKAFAERGYRVFALDRSIWDEADERIIPITADITSTADIERAFGEVSAMTDSLCGIIHFAGIYMLDSLVEMSEESFMRAFDVNLFGAFRINKVFLPLLRGGSRIVITASELAPLDPLPFTGIYAITKNALDRYAYSLRMELQLLGISVSVLRPGAVKTEMLGASTAALDRFCEGTQLYTCNAKRFKGIVDKVEAANVAPDRVARLALKAMEAKRPRHIYNLNRNPLLRLLNLLPSKLQTKIIGMVLK